MRKILKKITALVMTVIFIMPTTQVMSAEFQTSTSNNYIEKNEIEDAKIASVHNPIINEKTQEVTFCAIYMGNYPQSEVTDENLISRLKELPFEEHEEDILDGVKYKRIVETKSGSKEKNYRYFLYEPIKWRVLDVDGTKALLQSVNILDSQIYDTESGVDWSRTTLRAWLNSSEDNQQGFMNVAFHKDEKDSLIRYTVDEYTATERKIQDQVWILNDSEMNAIKVPVPNYARKSSPSAYAIAQSNGWMTAENAEYWARKECYMEYYSYAPTINAAGELCWHQYGCWCGIDNWHESYEWKHQASNVDDGSIGVCPAVYLDLTRTDYWKLENELSNDDSLSACTVTDVQWFEAEVNIVYSADRPCNIVIGFYNDDETKMIASEHRVLEADKGTYCVKVNKQWDDGTIVKVFLFDSESYIPLCKEYKEITPVPEREVVWVGKCGENMTYTLTEEGVLEISGEGVMYNYIPENSPFAYDNMIKEIIIHEGVESIGESAFYGADKCKQITLPTTLHSIGESAFCRCDYLTEVTIPDEVTTIAVGAFRDCDALTKVTLPKKLTVLGKSAFSNCISLKEISIPTGVAVVAENLFNGCSSLKTVTLSEGITQIAPRAFYNCTSLANVYLPKGLTFIDREVFKNCKNLTSVNLPESLTGLGSNVFESCSGLKSINFPDGLTSIPKYTFWGCGFTELNIPSNVKKIGGYAFGKCNSLTKVVLSEEITSLCWGAFSGCSKLQEINLPNSINVLENSIFADCDNLTSIVLPEGIAKIPADMFRGCIRLQSVILPEGLQSIGSGAFYNCGIKNIDFPDDLKTIEAQAFAECRNLSYIEFPSGLTSIGAKAFYNGKNLRKLVWGGGLTTIGKDAFNGTVWYSHQKITEKFIVIDDNLVELINPQGDVIIPDTVKRIGYDVIKSREGLVSLTIPESIIDIANIGNVADLKIYVTEGSYAHTYMGEQPDIEYYVIKENGAIEQVISGDSEQSEAVVASDAAETKAANMLIASASKSSSKNVEIHNLVVGQEYLLVVVKDVNAENLFSEDNLLYINQYTAEKDSITISDCVEELETASQKLVFGIPVDGKQPPRVYERPLGDVTKDEKLSLDDAQLVLKQALRIEEGTEDTRLYGDVNFDGKLDLSDAQKVLKAALRIEEL